MLDFICQEHMIQGHSVKTEMLLNEGRTWFGKEEDEPLFFFFNVI